MTATTSPGPAGSTVERPTSVDEAVKVLRDSRGSVLFRGAGTKMSWAGRPADPAGNRPGWAGCEAAPRSRL